MGAQAVQDFQDFQLKGKIAWVRYCEQGGGEREGKNGKEVVEVFNTTKQDSKEGVEKKIQKKRKHGPMDFHRSQSRSKWGRNKKEETSAKKKGTVKPHYSAPTYKEIPLMIITESNCKVLHWKKV